MSYLEYIYILVSCTFKYKVLCKHKK